MLSADELKAAIEAVRQLTSTNTPLPDFLALGSSESPACMVNQDRHPEVTDSVRAVADLFQQALRDGQLAVQTFLPSLSQQTLHPHSLGEERSATEAGAMSAKSSPFLQPERNTIFSVQNIPPSRQPYPIVLSTPHLVPTRAEIADCLNRTGWDPDRACKLWFIECTVDFGDGLSSEQLEVAVDLILSSPSSERHTLQVDTIALVARWLLRNRLVVGPDGGTVLGVRRIRKALKIVGGWIKDEIRRRHAKERKLVSVPSKARPGRPSLLPSDFIESAGRLWLKAGCQWDRPRARGSSRIHSKPLSKVTDQELAAIASRLDSKGFCPPAAYLERGFADKLRKYNSHNSNSKTGVILTWSRLVSSGDKDHLRGMRRLLSRCAKKLGTSK